MSKMWVSFVNKAPDHFEVENELVKPTWLKVEFFLLWHFNFMKDFLLGF
jgi:hypothetical protein